MLTVSLHGIKIHALIGMYPAEKVVGNNFEIDVDMWLPDTQPWPFADYSLVHKIVNEKFAEPGELLEQYVYTIHKEICRIIPVVEKVRVEIRKMQPPLPGGVAFSRVVYEK
jgi:7,8-dihydroneopterin aldolase/epimerase/oxygenase